MTLGVQVDCSQPGNPAVVAPLSQADQADLDARNAAAPAQAAALAAAMANLGTLNANVAGALARLRQIKGANPATVTLPQVAQAVSDMAGMLLAIARLLSNQLDGTT